MSAVIKCSKCKQEAEIVATCVVPTCKLRLCGNCVRPGETILDNWRCDECVIFGQTSRRVHVNTPINAQRALFSTPRSRFDAIVEESVLQSREQQLESELKRLTTASQAQLTENDRLRRDVSNQGDRIEQLINDLDTQRQENENLRHGNEALTHEINEMEKKVIASNNKCDNLQREFQMLREQIARTSRETMESTDQSRSDQPETSATHNPVQIPSTTANSDSVGTLTRCLADALRLLQGDNQNVSQREQRDDQLTLTMIRASLPELPEFNGESEQWPLFEKIYNTTTETGKYTDELNHLRLVKCLKGDAKDECQGLLNGMAGGTAIMHHLKNVYGDAEKVLRTQSRKLLRMKSPKELEKHQLKPFVVQLESFVLNAEALHREDFLSQPTFIADIVEKLRDKHQDDWKVMKTRKPAANLRDLLKYLEERLKDASAQPPSDRYSRNREQTHRRINAHQETSACKKCSGTHELQHCKDFKRCTFGENKSFVRNNELCECCLKHGHMWKQCTRKRACNLEGCKKFHHRALHPRRANNAEATRSRTGESTGKPEQPAHKRNDEERTNLQYTSSSVLYKILPVTIHGEDDRVVHTYAFLDDGSSITLLEREIYDKLKLKGNNVPLKLRWTGGIVRSENESMITACRIAGRGKSLVHELNYVRTVEKLDLAAQTLSFKELQRTYEYLRGVPMQDYVDAKPKILIGLKNNSFLTPLSIRHGKDDGPVAAKTKLGWTVYGATNESLDVCAVHGVFTCNEELSVEINNQSDEQLHDLVKSYFDVEACGINKQHERSNEDKKALEIIESTINYLGDQYEVGLLWRHEASKLPDNYPMAYKRLLNLERNLEKNPALKKWTIGNFKELQEKGYARKANERDLNGEWQRTWILPTFTVINENKIELKPRQVYDARAVYQGVSLNSELMSGPDLLVPLIAALYKFRERNVCVTADVTEMYNQIKLIESDQQCQRLLWRDCDTKREPDLLVFSSLSFGPTCAPAIAQAVKNMHASKYEKEFPEAVKGLIQRTFMDDYFNSHDTIEEAIRVSKDAVNIMKAAGFSLGKFMSNSKEVLASLPAKCVKESLISFEPDSLENVTKVLGMYWDTEEDCFTYRLHKDHLAQELSTHVSMPTKRQVLRLVMKIFDPLGMISHFTIRGKILLQEIWKDGTQWDQTVNERLKAAWLEWINQLKGAACLRIPRRYCEWKPDDCDVQLHIFVDASDKAYAACAYFRIEHSKAIEVTLVGAKAKVVPLKQLSIPRCELMAALIGARLGKTIVTLHDIRINSCIFWSDSKCVLTWINTDTLRFKQFVGARISEILELTTRAQWRYVPSKLNVADDATKCNEKDIKFNSRWYQGPAFLYESASEWPEHKIDPPEEMVMYKYVESSTPDSSYCRQIERFPEKYKSKWRSLVRLLAWMRRSVYSKLEGRTKMWLSVAELEKAEDIVYRAVQQEVFAHDYELLTGSREIPKDSKLYQLSPFMKEDGVIRMNSRLQNANMSYASRNPPILPNNHWLVTLLIEEAHCKRYHQSEEAVIADIRRKAWIINIRAAVRKVARNCQECKNRKAVPQPPKMGQLPEYRFEIGTKPFTHVGIDCFGPIEIAVGRRREKRWGMIFVCMVSRAIHVELVESMSSDHCIMAIKRFLSIRGPTKSIYSDNGKNFQGASNIFSSELAEISLLLGEQVADKFRIEWNFNPPWSPHFGGPFERMVQSVKRAIDAMLKSLGPRTPSDVVLRTALSEAVSLINSRPLTHTPVDSEDSWPLTPNDLLGQSNLEIMPNVNEVETNYCRVLYKRSHHLANVFMARWIKEYLPIISRRCKWFQNVKPLEVDDVVLIVNQSEPRKMWKKGRIIKTYIGKDKQVRVADVKTADGKIKKRAVHGLALLDVRREFSSDNQAIADQNGGGHVTDR